MNVRDTILKYSNKICISLSILTFVYFTWYLDLFSLFTVTQMNLIFISLFTRNFYFKENKFNLCYIVHKDWMHFIWQKKKLNKKKRKKRKYYFKDSK